jgi:phospholipase C
MSVTRRQVLRAGAAGALALGVAGPFGGRLARAALPLQPGELPDLLREPGEPTDALPFDHLVILMMENHSFDCYFGMLPRSGQTRADGFTFDRSGQPINSNPLGGGYVLPYRATSECQGSVTQNWNSTHKQIDGGRMDGFAATSTQSMVYWTESDLPFYYSLAKNFTLANRWFCSAPCQTYPNRRFLMAGTAYGNISTDNASLQDPPPPGGTIFDELSAHGVSWRNYFTDLPSTGIIPSIIEKHPSGLAPITSFFSDCAAGTLPAVSLVDPEFGVAGEVGGPLSSLPLPPAATVGGRVGAQGGSEENPQDIQIGQAFVARVVNAVLQSPAWERTLLVWTYDEHGGYYDHVPPPSAVAPDNIPPKLGPGDIPGGYDIYGPRVPAVVVSPYARPHAVTNVVHDHTSILATIEQKWNLPPLTKRDAAAATLVDFLDLKRPRLLEPPVLAEPGSLVPGEEGCDTSNPQLSVHSG